MTGPKDSPEGTGDRLYGADPLNEDFRDRMEYGRKNRIEGAERSHVLAQGKGDDKGKAPKPTPPSGPPVEPQDEPGTGAGSGGVTNPGGGGGGNPPGGGGGGGG